MMCKDLRVELVCLLERLCHMRLQSFSKQIEVPQGWEKFDSVLGNKLTGYIKKVLNNVPEKKDVEKNLKEEKDFKHLFFKEEVAILPGALFVVPTDDIITRPNGKPLFLEFPGVEEEIPPESLPFDIELLRQDIHKFWNPTPPPDIQEENIKPDMADNVHLICWTKVMKMMLCYLLTLR